MMSTVRAIPWIIAAIALVAFGASFSELQRMRGRFGDVTHFQVSHHSLFREFVIRSELAHADGPIVVMGDSITERAELPREIDGHPVINAGISGATIEDFEIEAPILLQGVKPSLVAVALGTNDAQRETTQANYAALLSTLKKRADRVLAFAVPPRDGSDQINAQIKAAAESEGVTFVEMLLPDDGRMPDGIHLSSEGYRAWTPALVDALRTPSRCSRRFEERPQPCR